MKLLVHFQTSTAQPAGWYLRDGYRCPSLAIIQRCSTHTSHDDVIKWKHFPRCEGNTPVTGRFPSQSQWHGALIFNLICAWTHYCRNNRNTDDLRSSWRHCIIVSCVSAITILAKKITTILQTPIIFICGNDGVLIKVSLNYLRKRPINAKSVLG